MILLHGLASLGMIIEFNGSGLEELEKLLKSMVIRRLAIRWTKIIRINPRYFRPSEVDSLLGDASLAKKVLGWEPKISTRDMCRQMV